MNQIATIKEPGARSVLLDMSDRYGMEAAAFEATLRATVVPKECSREQFAAFLLVAKEYKLNPILKEIYAFPSRNGIQPIVGVDGWANLINSHPAFDGMDFEDHFNEGGDLVSITCKMFRKDRSHPVTATEYLSECKRGTDPWKQWPRRMLRHKAMIQAARYAFSFAGIIDPDEAERFAGEFAQDVTPRGQIVPISQRIADAATETNSNSSRVDSPSPAQATDKPASGGDALDAGNQSQAKATEGKAGMAGGHDVPVRQSTAGTGLQVGEASADLPATSERMDVTAGETAPISKLPQGWEITYAAALRRAQKSDSLAKYATSYWEQYGGWAAVKDTDDGATASAIYDAFKSNFGDKEKIESILSELF